MDSNFWKIQYHDKWSDASKREKRLMAYLEKMTGLQVLENGLGAGSDEFISGSAKSNGYTKGDADLIVKDTNIYVEVTGPLSNNITVDKPLWFRPDKINNAYENRETHITFFAHFCPNASLWRVIYVNKEFISRCRNKEFKETFPKIRGVKERYVEIPADDKCIHELDYLIGYIEAFKNLNLKG